MIDGKDYFAKEFLRGLQSKELPGSLMDAIWESISKGNGFYCQHSTPVFDNHFLHSIEISEMSSNDSNLMAEGSFIISGIQYNFRILGMSGNPLYFDFFDCEEGTFEDFNNTKIDCNCERERLLNIERKRSFKDCLIEASANYRKFNGLDV